MWGASVNEMSARLEKLEKNIEALVFIRLWKVFASDEMTEADDWVMDNFSARTLEESRAKYPRGSTEARHRDLVASFWELCGYLVATGRLDEESFVEVFGGHPRTRWKVYRPLLKSARSESGRPEARQRGHYFEWLAGRCEELTSMKP